MEFNDIPIVILTLILLAVGGPITIIAVLANNYIIAGLTVFIAGFLVLYRLGVKRYYIFFLIQTRHGLNFVDKVARFAPEFWKFFGDMAIVVSFGGLGSYYVSRYRNTWLINAILGVFALALVYTAIGFEVASAGAVVLFTGAILLKKYPKPVFHFCAGAAVLGTIMFAIFPGFSDVPIMRPFVAILVGVLGIPALLVSMMFSQAVKITLGQSNVPGVSPLLPTISEEGPGFFFPGTGIFIPFWQALIAMICLLVPHELAHGILTRAHRIRLKSAGVLTASVIPIGAFVEPDERILRLRRSREKMRIYAVGSFTNLIVALLSILIIVTVLSPMLDAITEPTGMQITAALNGTPSYGVLQKGMIIREINGKKINTTDDFNSYVVGLKPNQTVAFVTSNGTFNLTLSPRPDNASRGYIGIDLQQAYDIREEFRTKYALQTEAVFFLGPTLFWIFFLSFNIALVNLLPITPFDGGKMFEEVMAEFRIRKRRKELIIKIMIAIILVLMLLNASPLVLNLFR